MSSRWSFPFAPFFPGAFALATAFLPFAGIRCLPIVDLLLGLRLENWFMVPGYVSKSSAWLATLHEVIPARLALLAVC